MPISDTELNLIDAYWRAANYLTVGQIYLRDNPLLREPLRVEHVKPRLLGHWGTSPGLSLIYAHVNRAIRLRDLDAMFLAGPGHGGPAIVANVYLEGTYSEIYPQVGEDLAGVRALFRQFSTPGGVPSHVGPQTPGSIHEGGELGYVLAHAFGAAFDAPELVAIAVVGDGEAETGPLEGSWKGISFLDPVRDGAVLPVLHLNGYKIAGPTVLGRASDDDVRHILVGHGYQPRFVEGADPRKVHRALAAALDDCLDDIAAIQRAARAAGRISARPRWPMIVLRTPKGWTGPREVDGVPIEGTFRAHQVPLSEVRTNPAHLALLEQWMKSYRPEELFDANGRLVATLRALAPAGTRRMGSNPRTNGGRTTPLVVPDPAAYALPVGTPGHDAHESTRQLGEMLRDIYRANPTSVSDPSLPRRDDVEPARRGVRGVRPVPGRAGAADRRPRRADRPRDGGAVRAQLSRLARGVHADWPARAVRHLRGVRADRRVDGDPAREVARVLRRPVVARRDPVAEHPADVDVLAQRPQRVLAPGPGLHGHRAVEEGHRVAHPTCRPTRTACSRSRATACAARTT